MNSRLEAIRRRYDTHEGVGAGIIKTPGKYEGEMLYVPYLWESGNGDDTRGEAYEIYYVGADLVEAFPNDLSEGEAVVLYEREDGFVCELSGGLAALADMKLLRDGDVLWEKVTRPLTEDEQKRLPPDGVMQE
jgi:hypothetical protein